MYMYKPLFVNCIVDYSSDSDDDSIPQPKSVPIEVQ